MTEIELGDQAREEVQPLPDPAIELQENEEIPPEEQLSDDGTFDIDSDSELSFTAPETASIPNSDRVLRPHSPVDYLELESPPKFRLFHISEANSLRSIDKDQPVRSYQGTPGAPTREQKPCQAKQSHGMVVRGQD